MVIVKQLSAEFKIELVAESRYPVADMLGLHFKIFVVIEADSHKHPPVQKQKLL
jgi:hypothetical protein